MADQNPLPEGDGGGFLSGEIMGIPTWVFIAGVGAVVVFLYLRRKSSAAPASDLGSPISGTTQVAGGAVDPYTGSMIDPFTGQPYTSVGGNTPQGQTLSDWITAAEKALLTAGYSPAAIAQAIYDYTNGNQLSAQEAGVINKALGLVGFPPVNLPFLGTPPAPKPAPKPPPKPGTIRHILPIGLPRPLPVPTGSGNGNKLIPLPALPTDLLHKIAAGGAKIIGSVRLNNGGAGYYFDNKGGVYAVGGAPFFGSYFSLPASVRNSPTRTFTHLTLLPGGGYTLVSNTGEKYNFPKPPAKKAA